MSWDLMDKSTIVKETGTEEDLGRVPWAEQWQSPTHVLDLTHGLWEKGWNRPGVQGYSMAKNLCSVQTGTSSRPGRAMDDFGIIWLASCTGGIGWDLCSKRGPQGTPPPRLWPFVLFPQYHGGPGEEGDYDALKRCPACSLHHVVYIKLLDTGAWRKRLACDWRFVELADAHTAPRIDGSSR